MRRQERERDAIGAKLDLLRLRDDGVVEGRLRLANLQEERIARAFGSTRDVGRVLRFETRRMPGPKDPAYVRLRGAADAAPAARQVRLWVRMGGS